MRTVFKKNYHKVLKWLRIDDNFIDALISKDYFTRTQLQSVASGSPDERGVPQLDMIKRSSIATYNRFVQYVELLQPDVALLLKGQAGEGLSNILT
jgi:hypothetical protein